MKSIPILSISLFFFIACQRHLPRYESPKEAAAAMDMAAIQRCFPSDTFPNAAFEAAFAEKQKFMQAENAPLSFRNSLNGILALSDWKELGPKNIGGRTLCLAFHPTNPNILWAGSASGGLWKTTTAGVGATAWTRVKTGFPVLGVAAIAVSPDAQTLYIGTGEVYGYRNVGTGFAMRLHRGSYGIGILKSTDGGQTWVQSLHWRTADLRGVQDIILNPLNPNTVFAATTEGVYRSYDAGKNWVLVNDTQMAVDLAMTASDTARLFCTFGSLYNNPSGIYRSLNSGASWTKLGSLLPFSNSGKTRICISPSEPNTIYASVADALTQRGLYRSRDGGDTWAQLNVIDVATYQGWFSHDVAVHPTDPNIVFHVGVWGYKSTDGGASFSRTGNINTNYIGRVPIGGPEGTSDYIHADMHAVYFHPLEPNKVFIATDGGIFVSPNTGINYEGRNGGYQTGQFYANFSSGQRDSLLGLGGLQDNFSAIYDGSDAWIRILDADGMNTAINPRNDSSLFASIQYLNVAKSVDKGKTFRFARRLNDTSNVAFNAPFDMAASDTSVLYAGGDRLFKSTDAGQSFQSDGFPLVDGGNPINALVIHPQNANLLYYATFPSTQPTAKLWKSHNGGLQQIQMMGLPNRVFTDIVFHPTDSNTVFVTLGGFNTAHLYRTTDGGMNWQAYGTGLPDIPTNTMVIDPQYPEMMYIGNDIGVYFSNDTGKNWQPLRPQSLPEACLVMHLSLSPSNRKLRAAMHGNGVYEIDLIKPTDKMAFASAEASFVEREIPIKTNFFLKKTNTTDTTVRVLNSLRAELVIPSDIPLAVPTPPQYPYPHPQAASFSADNYPLQIIPTKTDDLWAGLTTFDIVLQSRHILGVGALPTAHQMIAADINQDSSIDALDMLLLRRVILRRDSLFQTAPHWVFLAKTYDLPMPPPTLAHLPQAYFFNPYAFTNPSPFQFTAVKIGDVDNSYSPPLSMSRQNQAFDEPLILKTENRFLEKGQTDTLILTLAKATACVALQGSFKTALASLDIVDCQSDVLKNFSSAHVHRLHKNQINFSWHSETNEAFDKNAPIFRLTVKAHQSAWLSDLLSMAETELENAVYTIRADGQTAGQKRKINIQFADKTKIFEIIAQQPNPFSAETFIRYNSQKAGTLNYFIYDESGRIVFRAKENYGEGIGQLHLKAKEMGLTKAGIYILHIEIAEGQFICKLQKQ